jgi:hypothetical protein
VIVAGYKKVNPTGKSRIFFMMLILLSTILLVLGILGLFTYSRIHVVKLGRSMRVNSPRPAKFNELALIY